MNRKNKVRNMIIHIILLSIFLIIGTANAAIITVDYTGNGDYKTIGEAIGAANGGDTILVSSGIYNENIYINKPIEIKGIDRPTINGINPIILNSNGVVLDGFIIKGTGNGISISNYHNNIIKNNTIKLNPNSIGINLYDSSGNDIINNNISENSWGIFSNYPYSGNDIINNNISYNVLGIKIFDGMYYNIKDNVISNNDVGIFTRHNQWSNIKNNTINLNGIGVEIVDSWGNNNVTGNSIIMNKQYGIARSGPGEDIVYNNIFNNTNNYDISGRSDWNISKIEGINIIGGQYIGGNYWSNPLGKGFSDICNADYDKICETKNLLKEYNIDYLPLAKKDNKPPNNIDNLKNITYESTYINWTWKDPSNIDLDKIMIYINGVFKTNVTKGKQYYNTSGLMPNTNYMISTHTVDNAGNINHTWKNYTSKTKSSTIIKSITVTTPNGGENWARGTTKTTKWSYTSGVGSYVRIELLKKGILNKVISNNTPIANKYYNWYIPSTQILGNDYKIRVISKNYPMYSDISNNNFTISSATPSITVMVPNGGENWIRGNIYSIKWASINNPGKYVKISLMRGGSLNKIISSNTTNDGLYSWAVPSNQQIGTDYKIMITSINNPAYGDISNSNFRIS